MRISRIGGGSIEVSTSPASCAATMASATACSGAASSLASTSGGNARQWSFGGGLGSFGRFGFGWFCVSRLGFGGFGGVRGFGRRLGGLRRGFFFHVLGKGLANGAEAEEHCDESEASHRVSP